MPRFEYVDATSISEALSLLGKYGERSQVIAGGTDLLVNIRLKESSPECLIGISGIPELVGITHNEREGLRIGAGTTLAALEKSSVIKERFGILAQAASQMGSRQTRNIATIGGNLCNASPAADMAAPLLALDARVKVVGPGGDRAVALEDFFRGPSRTALKNNELLTEIQVPNLPPSTRGLYQKLSHRKAMDLAIVGVAVALTTQDGVCTRCRIALGSVAPTPIRARKAEEAVAGKKIDPGLIQQAARVASQEAQPISDLRGSAEYRRAMVEALVNRGIRQLSGL